MPSPSDNIAVEFRGVVKTYHRMHGRPFSFKHVLLHLPSFIREWRAAGAFTALNGVSFQVRKGETFGICGPNGSGKSTILALTAGVLRPTSGTLRVKGRVSPLLELGAGFHRDLTGRENVFLNATILGMSRREIAQRFESIVEFSGIREFIDEPTRTYSSGMFVRLGFSIAVHTDPELLLCDEVLAVGDAEFQARCLDKMKEFRRSGVTIMLVTHDLGSVERICDRALLLQRGEVGGIGDPREVVGRYRREAAEKDS